MLNVSKPYLSISYRPEIDGLRAIAVLAVVLYHAEIVLSGINPFKGGFIGVDVFLVISGYLITSIILKEINTGKFKFSNFYYRRIRRIIPVFVVMLAFCLSLSWIGMLPKALDEYAGSMLSSMAFGSNFWFYNLDSYNAELSALQPLLHTWSLSLEEQFYIVFPLVMICIWKISKKYITITLFLIFLGSLQFAQYASQYLEDLAFYLLPSRLWEFIGGGLIASLELNRLRSRNNKLTTIMPVIGLIMILASIFMLDIEMQHPSYITTLPVIGVMLLIWFCNGEDFISQILSSRFITPIGLISYSLYLWHFPIFVYSNIAGLFQDNSGRLFLILLALCLSVVSYNFIEKPARDPKILKNKHLFITLFIAIFLLTASGLHIIHTNGAEYRLEKLNKHILLNYKEKYPISRFRTYEGCWTWKSWKNYEKTNPFGECISNEAKDSAHSILVIGDSFAGRNLIPGLINIYGLGAVIQRVASSCFPFKKYNVGEYCELELRQAYDEIERKDPKLILITGCWLCYSVNSDELIGFMEDRLTSDLKNYKDRIIVVGTPPFWGHKEKTLPNRLKEQFFARGSTGISERLSPDKVTFSQEVNLTRKVKELGVGYISLIEVLCESEMCLTKIDDSAASITSFDYGHLTLDSSNFVIKENKKILDYFLAKE